MAKKINLLFCIIFSLSFLFISFGYASLSDTLNIRGNALVTPPVYDELIITDISTVSGTDVVSESHSRLLPTNVSSTVNGTAGQKVVYRITVHNYSDTLTYVYKAATYSSEFSHVMSNVKASASYDAAGASPLPNNMNAVSVEGTAIAPDQEFVFYVTYELTGTLSDESFLVRFVFAPIKYTVTYLDNNAVFAKDYIVDNTVPYYVRTAGPTREGMVFNDWVNANAAAVDSYPAGNTHDYTLTAKWDSVYLIMFVDENANIIYQETFTSSSKALSSAGQAIVDAKLAELAALAAPDDLSVAWSDYSIAGAKGDITVRPIYTYTGNLRFTPIDTNNDGIIDYYQVDAVAKLNDPTKIPGRFKGLSVSVVNKLYLNDNNFDYGAGVKTIEVGEGVNIINRNALAYTSDLSTVSLPRTLTYIDKNAFSRNFGDDKKVLTINYNGTMAEWQALVKNSHGEWHNGLKSGSTVRCSDGYYELDRGFLELGGYNWKAHYY